MLASAGGSLLTIDFSWTNRVQFQSWVGHESDAMLAYRLYLLGPHGHLIGLKEIGALGDVEARERAVLLGNDKRWELWHGAKLIARSEDHRATER